MDRIVLTHPPPSLPRSQPRPSEGGPGQTAAASAGARGSGDRSPEIGFGSGILPERLQRLAEQVFATEGLKLTIDFDKASSRFIYRSVDPRTGEVVKEYPPEEVVARIAALREIAGLAVDRKL
ncbi:MAG TPA: flagellar protein FlaG [Alphaproteobacteria bacterium]|jgi:hypothetical protein|nr:flagellar protein FlaG [Alphaproteobacteria bacterium]